MSTTGPLQGKLKSKFNISEVFYLLPSVAIYKGIHFKWLCFELHIEQTYE